MRITKFRSTRFPIIIQVFAILCPCCTRTSWSTWRATPASRLWDSSQMRCWCSRIWQSTKSTKFSWKNSKNKYATSVTTRFSSAMSTLSSPPIGNTWRRSPKGLTTNSLSASTSMATPSTSCSANPPKSSTSPTISNASPSSASSTRFRRTRPGSSSGTATTNWCSCWLRRTRVCRSTAAVLSGSINSSTWKRRCWSSWGRNKSWR